MEEESYSRSSRHQKSKPAKKVETTPPTAPQPPAPKQKMPFWQRSILVLLVLVLIGVIAGVFYYQYEQAEARKRFEAKEEELLASIREDRNQSGIASEELSSNDGNIDTIIFNPTSKDLPLKDAKAQLEKLAEKARDEIDGNPSALVVGRVELKHVTDQLSEYRLTADRYVWNDGKESFSQDSIQADEQAYINQATGKALSLKDIVGSQANLLGIFQVIQQKLLDESDDGNKIIDDVLNLQKPTLDKTEFTYTPQQLTLTLPKNDLKESITLDYKDIAAFVNTAFVDPDAIKDALPKALDPKKKYVSLTFDDGPNPETTPKLLNILKENDVKATFFMLGQNAEANPEVVKQVLDAGHEVASHSYDHPQLNTLDDKALKAQIQKTDKILYKASGKLPRNLRPPYGAIDKHSAEVISKPIIQWNIDSEDWKSHNTDAILATIKANLYDGSIILLHDIHPETVASIPQVIKLLKDNGYTIVPVNELLGGKEKPLHQYFGAEDERVVE